MKTAKLLHVHIGDTVSTDDRDGQIDIVGVGSCAGILVVSPGRFGAASHSLLPKRRSSDPEKPVGKYVDSAVEELVRVVTEAGYWPRAMKCWVVGGAEVFHFESTNRHDIGAENVALAETLLRGHTFRVNTEATGGDLARTVRLNVGSGKLFVHTPKDANLDGSVHWTEL